MKIALAFYAEKSVKKTREKRRPKEDVQMSTITRMKRLVSLDSNERRQKAKKW